MAKNMQLKNAKWIKSKTDRGTVCPVFQKNFSLYETNNAEGISPKEVQSAVLYITSLGVYEAKLNGKRVGDFILAPGWTSYHNRLLYQEYDVTALLNNESGLSNQKTVACENARLPQMLEVTVGKGWCCGRLMGLDENDFWSKHVGLIASLVITYQDQTQVVIHTDESWQVGSSAIVFAELYDGETFDARITPDGWEQAEVFEANKENLVPQDGDIVKEQEHVKPAKWIVTPKGERVIDFGQNLVGYLQFTVNAKAGDIVEVSHAEVLDSDGNFYIDNLRGAAQKISYICKDGVQTYKPCFTFMGFRYIRFDQLPSGIKLDTAEEQAAFLDCFTAIVVHSDMKRTGYFNCSSPMLNKLYENIIWGQKGNFLDIPTDCPQRNERLGWTGDAQVFVRTAAYNYDVNRFFKKWLRDLAADQKPDGNLHCIIPSYAVMKFHSGSAAWADAATVCPWQIYLAYGDKDLLEEQYPSMRKWVEFMHSQGENPYLYNTGDHFADWLGLDAPEGSYRGSTPHYLIATAYFAYSTSIVAKAAEILGKQDDVQKYTTLYSNVVKAFREEYPIYETQTAHALALYFDLAENKKETAASLVKMIRENGNKLQTGFVGTPYLLHVLSENGYPEVAYDLLLQEDYPSWLFSVKMGATTIWEHWDGQKPDGSFWSADMNSFNHYAYGAVADWMYGVAAGIQTDEANPGYGKVVIQPIVDKRLGWLSASLDTRHGTISSKWTYEDDGRVRYEIDVPVSAKIVLPGVEKEVCPGRYVFYDTYMSR